MDKEIRKKLLRAIVRFRLVRYADAIMRLAQPSLFMRATPSDDEYFSIGASKIGGCPDLPEGVAWPREADARTRRLYDVLYGDNTLLPFTAQINLSETAVWEKSETLPRQGILSLFYSPYTGGWQLLFNEGKPLIRHDFPEDLPYGSRHLPYSLTCGRTITLRDTRGHSEEIPGRKHEPDPFKRQRIWFTFAETVPVFDSKLHFVERELSSRRLNLPVGHRYQAMCWSLIGDYPERGITYYQLFDFRNHKGIRDEWGMVFEIANVRELTDYRKCGSGANLCVWARRTDILSKDFSRAELNGWGRGESFQVTTEDTINV